MSPIQFLLVAAEGALKRLRRCDKLLVQFGVSLKLAMNCELSMAGSLSLIH